MKQSIVQLAARPVVRTLLLVAALIIIVTSLDMFWKTSTHKSVGTGFGDGDGGGRDRLVTAHFMLGNTYPYVESDWHENFRLAEDTGIDAFALNIGPEDWQISQARTAYRLCGERRSEKGESQDRAFRLFLSLDMNVLPSTSNGDMLKLVDLVEEFGRMDSQLTVSRAHASDTIWTYDASRQKTEKIVLSTFSGGEASYGGVGWEGFLRECKRRDLDIYFIPSFFLPPQKILDMPFVDATFDWNGGWPPGNDTISTASDEVFIRDKRPYMAAVSPWFFTHYGTDGPWAWNKNWIYRSDDSLYSSRWQQILDSRFDPEFVQIISWNDYGESHYIGPVLGAQPGSDAWARNRDHDGWRLMTKYFIEKYKGLPRRNPRDLEVWLTYRTFPKDLRVEADEVGRPEHADWAQDVIAVAVLLPDSKKTSSWSIEIEAGEDDQFEHKIRLAKTKDMQTFVVPFDPGDVSFKIKKNGETILEGKGETVENRATWVSTYNFNAWTGHWSEKVHERI